MAEQQQAVFDQQKCQVPFVLRIEALPVIQVCAVPQAPEPIPDCPDLFIPPPLPEAICPQIGLQPEVAIQIGRPPQVQVRLNRKDLVCEGSDRTDECAYDFAFQFTLPDFDTSVCPDVQTTSQVQTTVSSVPTADVAVRRSTAQQGQQLACDYTFDFDFKLPILCPEFQQSDGTVKMLKEDGAAPKVVITTERKTLPQPGVPADEQQATCDYDFDFAFQIPFPNCPQLQPTATLTLDSGLNPGVTVAATRNAQDPQNCDFAFDFQFQLPDPLCPQVNVQATASRAADDTLSVDIQNTRTPVGPQGLQGCQYDLDFAFQFPCASISADATISANIDVIPAVTVEVIKTPVDQLEQQDVCDYEFNFAFQLPTVECPEIQAQAQTIVIEDSSIPPKVDVNVVKVLERPFCQCNTPLQQLQNCEYKFDFTFTLPAAPQVECPQLQVQATTTVVDSDSSPSVTVSAKPGLNQNPQECEFTLDFQFQLPQAPQAICPEIQATVGTTVLPAESAPSVALAVTTVQPCDPETGSVTFDFDFEFSLPEAPEAPDPICPQIQASASATDPTDTATATVQVTNAQNQCGGPFIFDFDFDFPAPACPVLSTETSVVTIAAGTPSVDVSVDKIGAEEDCDYQFTFDFVLPQAPQVDCPQLSAEGDVGVVFGAEPSVVVAVAKTSDEPCTYAFDFDFTLPQAQCPTIQATAQAQSVSSQSAAGAEVTVAKTGDDPCSFAFDFNFTIPEGPQGPQGPQGVQGRDGTDGTDGDDGLDGDCSECCNQISTEVNIVHTPGTFIHSVVASAEKNEACQYHLKYDWVMPAGHRHLGHDPWIAVNETAGVPSIIQHYHGGPGAAVEDSSPLVAFVGWFGTELQVIGKIMQFDDFGHRTGEYEDALFSAPLNTTQQTVVTSIDSAECDEEGNITINYTTKKLVVLDPPPPFD